jgi:hypothetical protein
MQCIACVMHNGTPSRDTTLIDTGVPSGEADHPKFLYQRVVDTIRYVPTLQILDPPWLRGSVFDYEGVWDLAYWRSRPLMINSWVHEESSALSVAAHSAEWNRPQCELGATFGFPLLNSVLTQLSVWLAQTSL